MQGPKHNPPELQKCGAPLMISQGDRPPAPEGVVDLRGDVAIVGMSCVFPGASDLKSFWENIVNRIDCIREASPHRWDQQTFHKPDAIYSNRAGFLPDVIEFDAREFGVMPSAAKGGNPDQFLALMCAHRAILDAGYLNRLNGVSTEVVLGRGGYPGVRHTATTLRMSVSAQLLRIIEALRPDLGRSELDAIREELVSTVPELSAESSVGALPNFTSSRIANRFDLDGASYTVDAACASTLVAVDTAVTDLLTGKVDFALAGGVHLFTNEDFLVGFSLIGALSPSGICRPFDSRSDGIVVGEGAGILALKRLPEARRHGDRIYAVIKGVGVASDGRSNSYVAPKVEGEMLALRRAYERSAVSPDSVALVEGHGTGTPLGDSVELQALMQFFGSQSQDEQPIALGSVKSMIGHALPAAGAASLIKTALALHHKVLPPSLHCEQPQAPLLDSRSKFYVNTEARPWIHGRSTPRRAGVSAFGFGGINAHVVLEDAGSDENPIEPTWSVGDWDSEVCVIAADNREQLLAKVEELQRLTRTDVRGERGLRLKDIAFSLSTAPNSLSRRIGIVAKDGADLNRKLSLLAQKLTRSDKEPISEEGIYYFPADGDSDSDGKVAFLFPGLGSQYIGMLADLCLHFPQVRACFDALDRHCRAAGSGLPSSLIFPLRHPSAERKSAPSAGLQGELWDYSSSSAAILQADLALFELVRLLGIQADMVAGHSSGQWVAMVAGGMLNATDVAKLFTEVGRNFSQLTSDVPRRAVLAVGTNLSRVQSILAAETIDAQIANDNCPHQVVINVAADACDAVRQIFRRHAVLTEILPLDKGYHSPELAALSDPFRRSLNAAGLRAPQVPVYSCTTAQRIDNSSESLEAAARIVCSPVRFQEMVRRMHEDGARIFVEVGPRSNLTNFVKDILRGKEHTTVALNSQGQSGLTSLHHALARLAARHVRMNLAPLYARRDARKIESSSTEVCEHAAPRSGVLRLSIASPRLRIPASRIMASSIAGVNTPNATPAASGDRTDRIHPPAGASPSLLEHHFATMTQLLKAEGAVLSRYLALRKGATTTTRPLGRNRPDPAFPCSILELSPGSSVIARRVICVASDPYLADHQIDGRYVVPLTMRMEMMAEVAQLLAPHLQVTRLLDLSASRWLALQTAQDRASVRIVASMKKDSGDSALVHVVMHELPAEGAQASSSTPIVAQADVVLARDFPLVADIQPATMATSENSISGESLYQRGLLFHGARMRGVQSVSHQDKNGLCACIRVMPRDELIAGNMQPQFCTDPVLIDSCGQLLGYWAQVFLTDPKILFPVRVQSIELYKPPSESGTQLCCLMTIKDVQPQFASVDIDVFDKEQQVFMKIRDWTDWRFPSAQATAIGESSRQAADRIEMR